MKAMNRVEVFTIGHSNHAVGQFIALLSQHGVNVLVDIRRFPSSHRLPHFSRTRLTTVLSASDIDYHWLESLGGHRKEDLANSPNDAVREPSFRKNADHMLGDEFREGIDRLLEIAENKRTAIMCAEKSYRDCHRSLTSDFLIASGIAVHHILSNGELATHEMTAGAKIRDGNVTYPESRPLFDTADE